MGALIPKFLMLIGSQSNCCQIWERPNYYHLETTNVSTVSICFWTFAIQHLLAVSSCVDPFVSASHRISSHQEFFWRRGKRDGWFSCCTWFRNHVLTEKSLVATYSTKSAKRVMRLSFSISDLWSFAFFLFCLQVCKVMVAKSIAAAPRYDPLILITTSKHVVWLICSAAKMRSLVVV